MDYVARLMLAEDRRHFFLHHLLDLVVIALPLLRPLTLLRLVSPLRVLNCRRTVSRQGRVALYIGGGAGLRGTPRSTGCWPVAAS